MDWTRDIPNPWATVSSTEVYHNPWTSVREDRLQGPEGRTGLYGYFDRKDAAMVLPLFADGSTLLVRQWRYAFERATWELIGGGLDDGEDPRAGAERELAEEGGLRAAHWTSLGRLCHSDARVRGEIHCFLAEDLSETAAEPEASECDLVRARVSLADCVAAVDDGRIDMVSTAWVVLAAARRLGIG